MRPFLWAVTSGSRSLDRVFKPALECLEPRTVPSFITATQYPAGVFSPQAVAMADLNGNGHVDLVVAGGSASPGTVSVLKGNGGGGFRRLVTYPAGGANPYAVAVGDLDGDQDLDLAVANLSSNTVSVLRNQGDGTLAAATNYLVHAGPASVAMGDVDGDGDLDLAVAALFDNAVSVLRNQGDGTFAAANGYGTGPAPWSVAVGDLDGDQDLDLAVATKGTVSVLHNQGDGTFGPATYYGAGGVYSRSVAMGDVDGDGDLDLAVASAPGPGAAVSVLRNQGDGTFAAATSYAAGANPVSVALGDVDGDQDLDLAVANQVDNGTVEVLRNQGDGTFAPATSYAAGANPISVAVADINGDGFLDLAVANYGTAKLSVLLNDGVWPPAPAIRRGVLPSLSELGESAWRFGASAVPEPSLPPLGEAEGVWVAALGEGEKPVNGWRAPASGVRSDDAWVSVFGSGELSREWLFTMPRAIASRITLPELTDVLW